MYRVGGCLFIALFWLARLVVQFFVFDAKPYSKTKLLAAGYHSLTLVFAYHAVVYWLRRSRKLPACRL